MAVSNPISAMHSPTSKAAALLLALGLTSRTDAVCIFGIGDCPEETSAPTFNPATNIPTSSSPTTSKEETTAPTFYPTTNIPTLSPTSKTPNSTSTPASITTAPISTTTIPTTSVQDPQNTQDSADCTRSMCEYQLSENYLLKYQINVPSDTTLEVCEECNISMEAVYEGEAWVSIAFSTDGLMIGSEAVM